MKLTPSDGTEVMQSPPEAALQPLRRRIWHRLTARESWGMRGRWWLAGLALVVSLLSGTGVYRAWCRASAAALSEQCRELSSQKQWSELATASARWAEFEPHKIGPWLSRAEAAEGVEDWDGVVRHLDRVPRGDGRAVAALIRKAVVEFEKLNRPWDSMRTCDEVLRLNPLVLFAHKQSIFFYAMTLQRAETVRRVRRAIQVRRESPESYVFLVGASWLYSGSLYRHNSHWREGDPDNEIFQVAQALHVYLSRAKSELEYAALFDHIPSEDELLERYPHNVELVAYFLNRSISEGDLERIHELLEAVPADVAEGDARFWRARAWCEDASGDFEAAEQSLRRAFQVDPYWWQIHFQLYDLLRRLGRQEESVRFFEMYRLSKALATEIKTLLQSTDDLDDQTFCKPLLELARMVGDDEVAVALQERLGMP
jgi:tetratricopeptide (TPR) repeat protein